MASISTDARGNRRILFVDGDGKRKPIRLGKMAMKATETIKMRVEHLAAAKGSGNGYDSETARWVSTIGDELASKLAAVGLIPRRERSSIGEFVKSYVESRKADTKPRTMWKLTQAGELLKEFLGAGKRLQDVKPADADDYRRWLSAKMGDNSARRVLGRAKQFFRAAERKKLLAENPFGDMKNLGVQANRSRDFIITREMADKVLAACPDTQWRLLFSLARWGGLRTPSEPLALTWNDIDWEKNRIRVSCIKTEHHDGRAERFIPIFPELRPHLETVFHDPNGGNEFVITRYRNDNSNLRTQMHRIIRRAGLTPWEKTFQNLRSTRETELAEVYPLHVVCSWLGHSPKVALRHYTQTTDEHFAKAAHIQAQQPPVMLGNASQPKIESA
ncbi:MAG: tyrosine-type recombinase/integrase [Planctomycetia bacterium]|nr:tyrosine-type recombinase/integrase [Planctomycetia bacterium]